MAIANKVPLVCIGTLHGGPVVVRTYPEAASQSFVKGEAVYLNGSGDVAEYTAAIDDGTQRFLGFAESDAHNDTVAATNNISVILGGAGNVFELNVTANGSDQVTAKTQVGAAAIPMYQDTTNSRVAYDISDTSGQIDCFRMLDLSPRDTVGDTNGRVLVTVVPAALQVAGT